MSRASYAIAFCALLFSALLPAQQTESAEARVNAQRDELARIRAERDELKPQVERPAFADHRHQETARDQPAQQPRHQPQLGKVIGLDGVHSYIVVQSVDAVQVVGLGPGDLVHPDPETKPFGVLRRVQLDPPQWGHVQRQQQERCERDDKP